MSSKGFVDSLINRLEPEVRTPMKFALDHIVDNGQIGGISHQEKAINFRWYRLDGTTSTTANLEFTVAHGLGVAPLHFLPMVPVTSSGTQMVRLKVTRAADAVRLYLSSPDTNASFTMLVEV